MQNNEAIPGQAPSRFRKWLSSLGPGIITAALVFGPGSLTITSKLGASFEYQLLWVIVVAVVFMVIFTAMGARIGVVTDASLLTVIRNKWGRAVSVTLGIGTFLITASFQAGNTIGASMAFAELFGTPTTPWIIVFTLMAMSLLFVGSFYRILEKMMIALVGLMLASFLVTLFLARPSLAKLATGLVPSVPTGAEMLSIALVASSFSVVGAFYQSYLVRERGWKIKDIKTAKQESLTGVIILGLISSFILINAAAILYPQGIQINSATDMGLALAPLYGSTASVIFMLGLFAASFSSLVGNATIGGALLADSFSLGDQLGSRAVRGLIMLVMAMGAAVALLFGKLPLELIIFAQAITIVIAPLIGMAMVAIIHDRAVMGAMRNRGWKSIGAVLGVLLLLFLAANQLRILFL